MRTPANTNSRRRKESRSTRGSCHCRQREGLMVRRWGGAREDMDMATGEGICGQVDKQILGLDFQVLIYIILIYRYCVLKWCAFYFGRKQFS